MGLILQPLLHRQMLSLGAKSLSILKSALFYLFAFAFLFCGFTKAQTLPDNPDYAFLNEYGFQTLPYEERIVLSKALVKPLSPEQKELLQVREFLGEDAIAYADIHIKYRLQLSDSFHAIVFEYTDANLNPYVILVTYSLEFSLVKKHVLAYQFPDETPIITTSQIAKKSLSTNINQGNRTWHSYFLFGHKGEIIQREYKTPDMLIRENILIDKRIVKAKNGLLVRDKAGNKIGKFDYAEEIYVLSYAPDSFAIDDGGKKIWGQKTKVILDYPTFLDQLYVPDTIPSIGYVFSGYLYKNGGYNHRINNYTEIEADDPDRYYYTNYIAFGQNWSEANVDIRQFMTINRVKLSPYLNRVVLRDSVITNVYKEYKDGRLILPLANGETLVLKDTVYESSEYSPMQHYQLFESPQLPQHYLVNSSFFEDSEFLIYDKTNGDTAATFIDYPFISPQKTVAVSFAAPISYDEGTAIMQLQTIRGGTFSFIFATEFIGWNIPNKKVIYWLSENTFILKVKEVEDNYSSEENAKFFYLKFTLK